MEAEIEAEFPQLDIQFVGVNQAGLDYGNETFTDGVDLPWLQDVDADGDGRSDAWAAWDVLPRDVVILDADNRPVATYNLTTHDIAEAENYAALKQLITEVASAEQQTGTINGHVYFDVNDNGQFDPAEAPIGGVSIELTGTTSTGETVQETITTQTDGSFSFQGLAAGTYRVRQRQPAMTIDGRETAGSGTATIGDDEFTVELGIGEDAYGYLFGERGRMPSAITMADFLASTPDDGIEVMVDAETVQWYCLRGQWQEFYYAEINVNPDTAPAADELPASETVEATRPPELPPMALAFRNDHGHRLEIDWPSAASRLTPLATSHQQRLVQVSGELIDVTQLERDAQAAEGEADPEILARAVAPGAESADWPTVVDSVFTGFDERDRWLW